MHPGIYFLLLMSTFQGNILPPNLGFLVTENLDYLVDETGSPILYAE